MNWYQNLYLGETCRGKKDIIIKEVESGIYRHKLFLITLAINGSDLLDIRSASSLARGSLRSSLPVIVGAASGREEAIQLASMIIEDCYRTRGDIDVRKFLEQ